MKGIELHRAVRFVAVARVLATGTRLAQAQDSLAARAALQLQKKLPGYEIAIIDPLTLGIRKKGSSQGQANLDRVAAFCKGNADQCDEALAEFASGIADTVRSTDASLTAAMLRAVARNSGYVRDRRRTVGKAGNTLVAVPFAGDITLVCEFDLPASTRPTLVADLKALGLTPAQAVGACKKNVEATLPSIDSKTHPLEKRTFGTIEGDGYTSSQVLFPERWASLAARQGGKLTVAVPGDDLVIYGRGDDQADIDAMSALVQRVSHSVARPVSQDVFRWTPQGWVVVSTP